MNIAPIILAAGNSSRFGSDKLQYPLRLTGNSERPAPLLVHSLRPWLAIFSQVFVVLKENADTLRHCVSDSLPSSDLERIVWLENAHNEYGMSASIVAGITATANASGWLIGLGDMPCLPLEAVDRVRQVLVDGAKLAAPFQHGRRGHPVGFSQRYKSALLGLQGDAGARDLLLDEAASISYVDVSDLGLAANGIYQDIDTVSDIDVFGRLAN